MTAEKRRTSIIPAQLLVQPDPRRAPTALDRRLGNVQSVGDLLLRCAGEETHFDDLGLARIERRQLRQHLVKDFEVRRRGRGAEIQAVQADMRRLAVARLPLAGMIDQSAADCLRVAWMGEIGVGAGDISASLRYNRPQSLAEEQEVLDVVRRMLEVERTYDEAMRTCT